MKLTSCTYFHKARITWSPEHKKGEGRIAEEGSMISCSSSLNLGRPNFMHNMIGVPEQRVREAALQEVHAQPGRVLHDQVQQDVDGLPVLDVILGGAFLRQSQEGGGSEGQKLFKPVFDVIVAGGGEEDAENLVDRQGQAVNIVLMAVKLGLKDE